jgi:hypothetical protein
LAKYRSFLEDFSRALQHVSEQLVEECERDDLEGCCAFLMRHLATKTGGEEPLRQALRARLCR